MMQCIMPNMTRPEFADKRVRQAMIYALDRAAIVKEIMLGHVTVINSCFFGWEWENGEPEGLNPYPYDPDKARQLLSEAGWDSSITDRVPLHPRQPAGRDAAQHLPAAVQGRRHQLRAASRSTCPTTPTASSAAPQAANTGDFELMLGSGGVMGQDPNITVKYFSTNAATPTGSNYNHFSNAQVDELMIQGRATNDVAERKRIYTEVAKIVNDEAVWIFLWRLNSIYGVNKRVQGFKAPGHPGRVISSAHKWSVAE